MGKSERDGRQKSFLTAVGSAEFLLMFGYNISSRSAQFCEHA